MRRSATRKYMLAVPILLIGSVLSPVFVFGGSSPRVLLVTGLGTYGAMGADTPYEITAAAMQGKGWTVGSMDVAEVLGSDPADLNANWDVVWILPRTETLMHHSLSKAGSSVEAFVQNGGVVVMPGISAEIPTIDASPGGVDVLSETDPGVTVIHDANHPFVAAAANGGVDLTVADLDPLETGGGGNFAEPPPGITLSCIARNDNQQIITEYTVDSGKVILSVLGLTDSNILNNLLIYVGSVVEG